MTKRKPRISMAAERLREWEYQAQSNASALEKLTFHFSSSTRSVYVVKDAGAAPHAYLAVLPATKQGLEIAREVWRSRRGLLICSAVWRGEIKIGEAIESPPFDSSGARVAPCLQPHEEK